jgi:hypothetical protein
VNEVVTIIKIFVKIIKISIAVFKLSGAAQAWADHLAERYGVE